MPQGWTRGCLMICFFVIHVMYIYIYIYIYTYEAREIERERYSYVVMICMFYVLLSEGERLVDGEGQTCGGFPQRE